MKTLLEAYNYIKEAGAPRPPMAAKPAAPAPVAAKPLGGTSSTGSSSIVPQAQPTQAQINNSRSLRNTTLPPGTNQTPARPMPMGGSVPGRQVASTVQAAKSPTMQGRPAGAPTTAVNVSRTNGPVSQKPGVNAATGSLTATDQQRAAGYTVTNVRDAAYGANPTSKKLGPASSTGGQGQSPVPTSAAVQPKISAAGMAANRARLASQAQAGRAGPQTGQNNVTPVKANAQIGASKQLNFKQAYAAARKAGQKTFDWNGKKYGTAMKGETAAKRSKVLARNSRRTAGANARRGSAIMEMVKQIVAEHLAEARKDAHPTAAYVSNKTPRGRDLHADYSSNFKAGPRVVKRYKGAFSEEQDEEKPEETQTKGKKSEKIDVRPEQETFKSNV